MGTLNSKVLNKGAAKSAAPKSTKKTAAKKGD